MEKKYLQRAPAISMYFCCKFRTVVHGVYILNRSFFSKAVSEVYTAYMPVASRTFNNNILSSAVHL